MLKRFEVENFKGFKNKIVLDLTAREYEFNKSVVKEGLVNKAIIYGKNGVGKSSLGIAIFDIILHLTDKERIPYPYLFNYLNLETGLPCAKFRYVFQFDDDEVIYEYVNNSNILTMGARVVGTELAKMIARHWLTAEFEGGRHQRRIDMIAAIEDGTFTDESV